MVSGGGLLGKSRKNTGKLNLVLKPSDMVLFLSSYNESSKVCDPVLRHGFSMDWNEIAHTYTGKIVSLML